MKTFIAIKNSKNKFSFLTPDNMSLLRSFGEVREAEGEFNTENICRAIGDADAYMTCWGSPRLDGEILEAAPNVKLLVHLCGTVAPFVSEKMWERGIRVISGNDFFAESTAEGALSYIFAAQRDIPGYSTALKNEKKWKTADSYSRGLLGKTVGVVSYGAVAKNLIRMLQPFRVKLLVYDIVPIPEPDKEKYGIEQVSLERLFSESDIISVHTPLNEFTHGLVSRRLLELIKPDALFVNASRGKIIDEEALTDLLYAGRFRAAMDVYTKEPPEENSRLYGAPNLLMMPHMAGPTVDLREDIAKNMIMTAHNFTDLGLPLAHEITSAQAERMSER